MRAMMLSFSVILVLGATFVRSETVAPDPFPAMAPTSSAQSNERTLKGMLGPKTEVTITYNVTRSPTTVQIGQKKFVGNRYQSVVYFSEFIKGKTDIGYELELSPTFQQDGEDFVYRIPGTAVSLICGSPDSLVLTVFNVGEREKSSCIEVSRQRRPIESPMP